MTTPTAPAEVVESAEVEIELYGTDGVIDIIDRRRVLLQMVFGVDVPPDATEAVFTVLPQSTSASGS